MDMLTTISRDSGTGGGSIIKTEPVETIKEVKDVNQILQLKEEDIKKFQQIVDAFHKIWYPIQGSVSWMGHEMCKCPFDTHMYQEIIYECKPDLIVECGTYRGGSALFLANMCDLVHHGRVVTIDIQQHPTAPLHPRIDYLIGSSVDEKTIQIIEGLCNSVRKVMVILDSDHTKQHVLDELEIYSNFVTPHQYLIVEDTDVHGHPVREDHPAGPYEAVMEFMQNEKHASDFIFDKMCERFLMTLNPSGYLRRIR